MKRRILTRTRIETFDPSMVKPQVAHQKPYGIWYECGDEWIAWLYYNDPDRKRVKRYKYAYEVEVDLAKMIVIRTAKELDAFDKKFWAPWGDRSDRLRGIAWQTVAKVASGIEICPYIGSRREKIAWYWSWDVASGCIWRGDAIVSLTEVSVDDLLRPLKGKLRA